MKILVLSLLRLGDIIQQEPLLKALGEKFPHAEIHLAIHRQFASVSDVLNVQVAKYHYFERDLLQQAMGEIQFNLFSPFDVLEKFISEINGEKFDMILNWTHNRMSAALMGTLQAAEKQGLQIENGRVQGLESRWIKYFNDHFSGHSISHFHYVEILAQAFGLSVERPAAVSDLNSRQRIFLQCFTSDVKKNWPLKSFKKLKGLISSRYPEYSVQILAAPHEREQLIGSFDESDLVFAELKVLKELLQGARLLISCDTSIKHLAAREGVPTLEVSLGGSTPVKTGAFSVAARVVRASSACYPCQHSATCPQKSFLCHESVSVQSVFEEANRMLTPGAPAAAINNLANLERTVWANYLNQNLISGGLLQPQFDSALAVDLAKKTDLLMAKQIKFESCEDFNLVYSTLQELVAQGADSGSYFQKLGHVFRDRYVTAEKAFQALKDALSESRELIQIRRKIIETFLSLEGKNAE